jgi:hypothetical protein
VSAAQQRGTLETHMSVKIGTFGPLAEAEFAELRQQKVRKANPALVALLDEIATGRPVRYRSWTARVLAACGWPSA